MLPENEPMRLFFPVTSSVLEQPAIFTSDTASLTIYELAGPLGLEEAIRGIRELSQGRRRPVPSLLDTSCESLLTMGARRAGMAGSNMSSLYSSTAE